MTFTNEQVENAYLACRGMDETLRAARATGIGNSALDDIVTFSKQAIMAAAINGDPVKEIAATALTFFCIGLQVGIKLQAARQLEQLLEEK